MHIYSPQGLRDLAIYLDNLIEGKDAPFQSQNQLAEISGVPANTLKALRRNRSLTGEVFEDGQRYHKPTIETILTLAAAIPDPATSRPFDPEGQPCRLEAVVRGWEPLWKPETRWKPIAKEHPYAKIIEIIRAKHDLDPSAFSANGITAGVLDRLCNGDRPTLEELYMLQPALGIPFQELFQLYGIDPKKPLPNGNGSHSKKKA